MNPDKRIDEELNRVIAEWCGWKFVPEHDVSFSTPAGHVMPEGWTDPEGEPYSIPPNYCRDLNACHEAEGKLELQQSGQFAEVLKSVVLETTKLPWVDAGSFAHIHATARQRAEAIVRVIEQQKGSNEDETT